MRIARSTSPRRRKRLPSANCSSTVCGFSFATCRNDSIALSGCSFSRKFRPLKYDDGIARDSDSSDLMSTRAAIQPMPKKSGRARSHQNSNSIRTLDVGRQGHHGIDGFLKIILRVRVFFLVILDRTQNRIRSGS